MRVFKPSADAILEISQLLLRGEVVAIPTETVYGLAADAMNPEAVEEIYRIKGRPTHNPLIVHIHDPSTAENFIQNNPVAQTLMDAFWPGSLTLVLPKRPIIPSIVTAGLDTVGIRMPKHPAMQSVLAKLNRPLAAPSANPSNYISPTRIEHVMDGLKGKLKYALDGGPCTNGVESTIVDACDPENVILLRPGPITISQIEQIIGQSVGIKSSSSAEKLTVINSPGQLKKHYSPRTPIFIGKTHLSGNIAYVHFSQTAGSVSSGPNHFFLSYKLDHKEAESHLYTLLQELDKKEYDTIAVDLIPHGEQWNAIRDRLTRASCQN